MILAADRGDFAPQIQRGQRIVEQYSRREWVLEGLGTSLKSWPETSSRPDCPGFALLLLASQYMKPVPFEAPGLGNVALVLAQQGWNEREVRLIRDGWAMTTLIKPDVVSDLLERPSPADPRWYDPTFY
jgi:hypothetical protein